MFSSSRLIRVMAIENSNRAFFYSTRGHNMRIIPSAETLSLQNIVCNTGCVYSLILIWVKERRPRIICEGKSCIPLEKK